MIPLLSQIYRSLSAVKFDDSSSSYLIESFLAKVKITWVNFMKTIHAWSIYLI